MYGVNYFSNAVNVYNYVCSYMDDSGLFMKWNICKFFNRLIHLENRFLRLSMGRRLSCFSLSYNLHACSLYMYNILTPM